MNKRKKASGRQKYPGMQKAEDTTIYDIGEEWLQGELEKIEKKVQKKGKHKKQITRHRIVFWMTLVVASTANLGIAALFAPFIITMNSILLDIVFIKIGLIAGVLYWFLLKDVLHLQTKHHVMAGLFIPVFIVVQMLLIGGIAQQYFHVQQRIWGIAVLYSAAFIMPYIFHNIYINSGKKSGSLSARAV